MGARYGRYETIRRIAAGGMATVHLGRTQGPGGFERLVAVKVMHEHIAADPAFRDMFLDEARLCARIRHPNVVATIDVAEDGRFIVMEYIEGVALDVWLQDRREQSGEPLPISVTLRVMLDGHCDQIGMLISHIDDSGYLYAQTIGGYAVLGQLIAADLPLAGQLRPGDDVQFEPTTIAAAHRLLRQQQELIDTVRSGIRSHLQPPQHSHR